MNSLWCCNPVLALNSGFLGHMHERQSQLNLKLDISLESLIHKELGNTGSTHLPVQKVYWKNNVLLCRGFFVYLFLVLFQELLYVCKGLRPNYYTEQNFIL